MKKTKYIFVTGGVVSSVGKGLAAASLGALLEARGFKVCLMKFDPYINVDPGTMSPFQHGEVFVTNDGAETDLDLGHYERFTKSVIAKNNSISTGQIYEEVILKERRGDYLGATVQVIPHVTDLIKTKMKWGAKHAEIVIIEIGGTVGDIESLPFLESIRQMRLELGYDNSIYIHVTYVPYITAAGELKSKPTQHSVKELREIGIQPDFLICRTEQLLDTSIKKKIGLFCDVKTENVIAAPDASSIYEVPSLLNKEGLDKKVLSRLKLSQRTAQLSNWKKIVRTLKSPKKSVKIGIIGKYVDLRESYKSLHEALVHGGIANSTKVEFSYIDSEKLNKKNIEKNLKDLQGLLVPGGFGPRGAEGKILAIQYARENKVPFLGICLGMQMACIEFARNLCGLKDATSREFNPKSKNLIIDFMENQSDTLKKGGTMRLGAFSCSLKKNSLAHKLYKKNIISERHRHRYEFNNKYKNLFESRGLSFSGIYKHKNLVEIIEVGEHPFFIGVQYHPEFQSKPTNPHPLFVGFIKASIKLS